MAICFFLTMLCIVGIYQLDEKTGFISKGFDAVGEALFSDSGTELADGELAELLLRIRFESSLRKKHFAT